jgi:hypothetical protein
MYPALTVVQVEAPTNLRELMEKLGESNLYAYDRRVVGVLVNNRRLWPTARLSQGGRVVVYPLIVGG